MPTAEIALYLSTDFPRHLVSIIDSIEKSLLALRPIEDPPDPLKRAGNDQSSSFSTFFSFLNKPIGAPSPRDSVSGPLPSPLNSDSQDKTTGSSYGPSTVRKTFRKNAKKLFFKDKNGHFQGWVLLNGWYLVDASFHVQHSLIHKGYTYEGSLGSSEVVLRQIRSSFRFCETAQYQTRNTLDLVRFELKRIHDAQVMRQSSDSAERESVADFTTVQQSDYGLPMSLDQAIQRVRNILLSLQAARDQLLSSEAKDKIERSDSEFLFMAPPCPDEMRFEAYLNGPNLVTNCYGFTDKSANRRTMTSTRGYALRPQLLGALRPMAISGKVVQIGHTLEQQSSIDYVAEYIRFLDEAFSTTLVIKNAFDTLKSMQDAS
eukprot:ANDGO_02289.mRNA.1 hypothetical protein